MEPFDKPLTEHFAQYISSHKKELTEKILGERTRYLTVVMEDLYQSQNVSAVVRTCECMGVQDIHVIDNKGLYEVNRKVLKGSNKWIDMYKYNQPGGGNTLACFSRLKDEGYRICVAAPSPQSQSVYNVDVPSSKIALVFGNELMGLSAEAKKHCDIDFHIPMQGFTESFNVSVSVALTLNVLMTKLRESTIDYHLSDEEKDALRLKWFRKMVKGSGIIEKAFLASFHGKD